MIQHHWNTVAENLGKNLRKWLVNRQKSSSKLDTFPYSNFVQLLVCCRLDPTYHKTTIKQNVAIFWVNRCMNPSKRGARKTAKPSKIKARSSRPCTNCLIYRCAYDVHNYDAQPHRAGQIISPLTLQTITIARMLSVGGEGFIYIHSHWLTGNHMWPVEWWH